MAKFSYEQKFEVILGVIEKGMSFREAANLIGACHGEAQKWVRMYEVHGVEGLFVKSGAYDGQFKIFVVEYMHTNALSIRETAVKFGVPSFSTVFVWERIYNEQGREALLEAKKRGRKKKVGEEAENSNPSSRLKTSKPNPGLQNLDQNAKEDLIAENQRLKMENAYLKKLQALVQQRVRQNNRRK
jgi:transposase